jgi:heme/copper-type cytochrome/quinol oxidase subunit 2
MPDRLVLGCVNFQKVENHLNLALNSAGSLGGVLAMKMVVLPLALGVLPMSTAEDLFSQHNNNSNNTNNINTSAVIIIIILIIIIIIVIIILVMIQVISGRNCECPSIWASSGCILTIDRAIIGF